MSIARQQAVLSTLPAGFRPFDVSNEILKIRPADTLLLTLLMALNKVTVDSRQFIINQQEMDVSTFTISAIGNGPTANVLTTTSQDEVDAVEVGMNVRKDYETVALVVDVNTTDKKITVDDASGFTANDVLVMGGAIVTLFFIPWLDTSRVRSCRFRPLMKQFFWAFAVVCVILGYCGSQSVDAAVAGIPLIWAARLATFYYFLFFWILMPIIGLIETPKKLPTSIAQSVLGEPAAAPAE